MGQIVVAKLAGVCSKEAARLCMALEQSANFSEEVTGRAEEESVAISKAAKEAGMYSPLLDDIYNISEFMRDTLRWLPARHRIHFRLSTIVWLCVLGIAPTYLLELFILTSSCTGRQSLRSASIGDFVVPHARTAIKQHRAFSIVGPSVWNSLPSEIRSLPRDLSSSFYKLLKTFIFARAWAGSASE